MVAYLSNYTLQETFSSEELKGMIYVNLKRYINQVYISGTNQSMEDWIYTYKTKVRPEDFIIDCAVMLAEKSSITILLPFRCSDKELEIANAIQEKAVKHIETYATLNSFSPLFQPQSTNLILLISVKAPEELQKIANIVTAWLQPYLNTGLN